MNAPANNDTDPGAAYDPRAIDWDEVEKLRQIPGPEKLLMGLRLQELARITTMSGIRHQHPDADEAEVLRIFGERMRKRELDNRKDSWRSTRSRSDAAFASSRHWP